MAADNLPIPARMGERVQDWLIAPMRTGVVVVDVWSRHWCGTFTSVVEAMAPAIGSFVDRLRDAGATVIHAPGGIRYQFADHPAYLRGQAVPDLPLPAMGQLPGYSGSDPFAGMSRLRCPSGETPERVGYTVHEAVTVDPEDFVIFTPETLWNLIHARNLTHLLYVGFAANNCLRGRPYGMLPMRLRGIEAAIVRDLTAVDFFVTEPAMPMDVATDRWLRSVEPTVGPSVASWDIVAAFDDAAGARDEGSSR